MNPNDPPLSEEKQIELLAYHIYVEEGRPDGKAAEHWARAERCIREHRMHVPLTPGEQPPRDDGR